MRMTRQNDRADLQRYSDTLPKKYMAAGALLFNEKGELLILHPTYMNRWEIVGGIVEANESSRSGCTREIQEEIGLEIVVGELLCVDYSVNIEGGWKISSSSLMEEC